MYGGRCGGADLAVDEGVAAGNGSAVYQACESADLGHAQEVAALRKFQNLFQILPVCKWF